MYNRMQQNHGSDYINSDENDDEIDNNDESDKEGTDNDESDKEGTDNDETVPNDVDYSGVHDGLDMSHGEVVQHDGKK
jgi:hypothetical protein